MQCSDDIQKSFSTKSLCLIQEQEDKAVCLTVRVICSAFNNIDAAAAPLYAGVSAAKDFLFSMRQV